MTLALLLTAVTGAWAQEETLLTTITPTAKEQASYSTANVATVSFSYTAYGSSAYLANWGWWGYGWSATVNAAEGYTITKCIFYDDANRTATDSEAPFVVETTDGDKTPRINGTPIDGGNQWSKGIIKIEVYGYVTPPAPAESDVEVTPGSSANTWTFAMPGSDVVLTPLYAPAAKWDVVDNVEQLPAALEGIIAGQDEAIVTAGQSAQGTVMYAVTTSADAAPALTAFNATVPTAKNVADDGADVLVWYYIQGADAPEGEAATLDNTFSDTEPACLTVQVLSNKFDIQLNAANANTIEAGKATVTVGGTAATVTDGKLQGVKMGSEVKLEAKPGYKFRKVEVKKKEATPLDNTTTAWTAGTFAVPAGGLTYSDAITVSGDVTLVLTDGQTLTLNKGISLDSGATLTIQGNGTMNVNGTNESTASTVAGTGTLVLTSGTLTAKGGNGGSVGEYEDEVTKSAGGIAINGAVTVSGGTLTATGGNGGAGGSGQDSRAGAGAAAISGDVTVSGGTLTATGGNGGSFSGDTLGPDGYAGAGGTAIVGSVTITDGTVTATGGNGGSFTISNYGYALYAGNGGAAIGGNATLTGGTLNQTNGTNGTLGGSGTKEECSAGTGGKAVAGTVTDNR